MTQTDSAVPVRPRVPTGQELFDTIMAHIEPELTSEGLKTLNDKYQSESPADFQARKSRYAQAFDRYDQAYQGYLSTLQGQVNQYRKTSFAQAEIQDRAREGDKLQSISKSWA